MSEAQTVLEELRRLPLCQELEACDPEGLEAMAALGRLEQVSSDATIFSIGGEASELRFVLSGRVALTFEDPSTEPRTVGTASAGDMLGWSALRDADATFTVTARATKPTRCLVFPGHAIRDLCREERQFGYCLMRHAFEVVAHRLADARLQLLDVYGRPRRQA